MNYYGPTEMRKLASAIEHHAEGGKHPVVLPNGDVPIVLEALRGATKFDPATLPDLAQRNEMARLYVIWYAAWDRELAADSDESVSADVCEAATKETSAAMTVLDAYCNSINRGPMVDFDENLARCAASGVPLWENDEILDDQGTGEMFLRMALCLPPRPVKQTLPEPAEEAA